jgi:hypothetical protein
MAHVYLPPKVFANAGLKLLKNNLVMAKLCDAEGVDKEFQAGRGGTIYVKRPPEVIVRSGATASPQDLVEGQVPVTIDQQKGVDVQFNSQEATLNLDALLKDKMMNASMAQLATTIDGALIARVNEFHHWVGTPGTTMSSPVAMLAAAQRMDEMAIPVDERNAILTPADGYGIAGSLLANAAQAGSVAGNALQKAKVPMLGNIDSYITQTIPSLTTGSRTNGTVAGAGQAVAYTAVNTSYSQTLNVAGLGAAGTVKAGEVFTLNGVNAVNPRTKADLGYKQQFTVLADATADGAGAAALSISPAIIASGAYQNVSAGPANSAVVTWLGAASTTFRCNAAFHPTAIKLVSAKLVRPFSGECDFATDPDSGLSIRYWRYSDGTNDLHNHRFDVFYGTVCSDRRLGVRVSG